MKHAPASASSVDPHAPSTPPQKPSRPYKVWPVVLMFVAYWAVWVGVAQLDITISKTFLTRVAAGAILLITFVGWWLTNRAIAGRERLLGLAALVIGCGVTIAVARQTLTPMGVLFIGLPWALTAWGAWVVVSRSAPPRMRRFGLVAVIALTWTYFGLIRMDGLTGDLQATIRWRWEPRPEDFYLAGRAKAAPSSSAAKEAVEKIAHDPLVLQDGDWTDYRGPLRDGVVHGTTISTDWDKNPPQPLWRKRVGPAWSSMLVIGGRLFTQEQRGESEAVFCLDASTGEELWAYEYPARHWESQGGAGPRATPTFDPASGRIFALGATGRLIALDAGSGRRLWESSISEESGAKEPMWGFSSSPLVVGGVVVVYAGSEDTNLLLGYDAAKGNPVWKAPTGKNSYSSPIVGSFDGREQILFLSDHGLTAIEPASGTVLWEYVNEGKGVWRAMEPRPLGENRVLVGTEDMGLVLLNVAHQADAAGKPVAWSATPQWTSKGLKSGFNDFVVLEDDVYGFDGSIFACVDLATGERRWKRGRYGHGQVLLLADQRLLLVLAESGEVILVAATPDKHSELARFQAINGKTWNHPALAHGRLYVRNDEEMACYELPAAAPSATLISTAP